MEFTRSTTPPVPVHLLGIKRLSTRLVIAGTVVFIWSAPHLASRLSEHNRHYTMWELQDMWWYMLPVLAWALPAVMLSILVDYSGSRWAQRAFRTGFLLALGGGLLTLAMGYLAKLRDYRSPLLDVAEHFGWITLALVAGHVLCRDHSRLMRAARALCLIGSPAAVLIAAQLALGPSYPQRMDALALAPSAPQASVVRLTGEAPAAEPAFPPVYWFICDEWSYERTYVDHELPARFKNLDKLSRRSVVFHQARTPGSRTEVSVPCMLYGTSLSPVFESGQLGFREANRTIPVEELESVFAKVGNLGYYRALVGFGLPYAQWVGRDLDLCRSHSFMANARSVRKALSVHAAAVAGYSADPLMKYLRGRWLTGAPYMYYYRQLHADMRADVEWVLTQAPPQTFALFHYMLPHKPYLFGADGEELALDRSMTTDTVESYDRHLSCLDVRLGAFLDLLEAQGRLESALVVITSDHSWRADPLRRSGLHPVDHVPLIVKLPGQTETLAVHTEFSMYRIAELIEFCLRAGPTPARLAEWSQRLNVEPGAASGELLARGTPHPGS